MKAGAFRLFSLCSVALLLSSCFALDPGNVMAAWAEAGGDKVRFKRVASWYAKAIQDDFIFCRADLSYDSEGRLVREEKRSYNYLTHAVTITVIHEFEYNDQGNISCIRLIIPEYGNSATSNHYFEYDENGLLTTSIKDNQNIPTSYTYEDGQLTRIEAGSETNTLSWKQGRPSRYSDGGSIYSCSYDSQGKCTRIAVDNPHVHSDYVYDSDGLLILRRNYDEVKHAYSQVFEWEWGTTSYDISDVAFGLTYQFGLFHSYGLP